MHQFPSRAIFGVCLTVLVSFFAASSTIQAMICIAGGPPTCFAAPGDRTCSNDSLRGCHTNADCDVPGTCVAASLGIAGTATGNPYVISSIALSGATNVSLSVGTTPGSVVRFRVVPTDTSGQAIVVATDTNGGTCRVPVSFRTRTLGVASNEEVCPLAEQHTVVVVSAPSSPAGMTACSSHLATCADVPPPGHDFLSDHRILTIRSPIAGSGVVVDLIKEGTFDARTRLLFSRSTDFGDNFTAFADVTTSVSSGSTRVRGTTQWSDVRVAPAVDLTDVPTLGEWGMILTSLLLLTVSSVVLARRRFALAAAGRLEHPAPALFDPRIFVRALAGTVTLALAALAAAAWLQWGPSATDVAGSLLAAGILGYQVHLWAVLAKGSSRSR